jgi:hypothetical protein
MKRPPGRVLGLCLLLILGAPRSAQSIYDMKTAAVLPHRPGRPRVSRADEQTGLLVTRRTCGRLVHLHVSAEPEPLEILGQSSASAGYLSLREVPAQSRDTVTSTVHLAYVARTDYQWGLGARLGPQGRRLWRFGQEYVVYFSGDAIFAGCYGVLMVGTAALLVSQWLRYRRREREHRRMREEEAA